LHKDGVVPELVTNWREGRERDWVLANDGGIVQILRQKPLPHPHDRANYKNHENGWCRTIVGTFIQDNKFEMDTDFDLHPNRYTFTQRSAKEVKQRARARKNPTKRERIFSVALATGKSLQMSYEEAYGASTNWREKALELVKRETVMTEVRKSVQDVAKNLGIDIEGIFKEMWDLAKGSEDDSVRFRSLKELKDTLIPKETHRSSLTGRETFQFGGFGGDKLKEIESAELKVLAEGEEDELSKVPSTDGVEGDGVADETSVS